MEKKISFSVKPSDHLADGVQVVFTDGVTCVLRAHVVRGELKSLLDWCFQSVNWVEGSEVT